MDTAVAASNYTVFFDIDAVNDEFLTWVHFFYSLFAVTNIPVQYVKVFGGAVCILVAPYSRHASTYYIISSILVAISILFLLGFYYGNSLRQGVVSFALTTSVAYGLHTFYAEYFLLICFTLFMCSLGFVYWRGPPSDPDRVFNLFEGATTLLGTMLLGSAANSVTQCDWHAGMQGFALCRFLTLLPGIFIAFINYQFAILPSLVAAVRSIKIGLPLRLRVWLFTRPRKLLTEEEYDEQGWIYTQEQLNASRHQLLNSPSADLVKQLHRLQNPKGFLDFLAGADHVSSEIRHAHAEQSVEGYANTIDHRGGGDPDGAILVDDDDGSLASGPRVVPLSRMQPITTTTPPTVGYSYSKIPNQITREEMRQRVNKHASHPQYTTPQQEPQRKWTKAALEQISDTDIVTALKHCGLAVIPVTATSRPILIRRLTGRDRP
eukprot:m.339848 g.339848  ORF g.339848 m.339848 type:complete len:435 (-) comp20587_c0_seq9:294-1598(-)